MAQKDNKINMTIRRDKNKDFLTFIFDDIANQITVEHSYDTNLEIFCSKTIKFDFHTEFSWKQKELNYKETFDTIFKKYVNLKNLGCIIFAQIMNAIDTNQNVLEWYCKVRPFFEEATAHFFPWIAFSNTSNEKNHFSELFITFYIKMLDYENLNGDLKEGKIILRISHDKLIQRYIDYNESKEKFLETELFLPEINALNEFLEASLKTQFELYKDCTIKEFSFEFFFHKKGHKLDRYNLPNLLKVA